MKYVCKHCSKVYEASASLWRCECGASLWCDFFATFRKKDIDSSDLTMWRYSKAYPLTRDQITVSYNEGLTPLARTDWDGLNLLIKMDCLMPSGSFKDRGVAMVINYLRTQGVKHITEDSSGNAGASNAAYAALAGIRCDIYVPAGAAEGKLMQTRLYNARMHAVSGSRDAVAQAAQQDPEGGVYAGHNWHPFFVQGTKSAAYEMWEQNGFKAPEAVVSAVGNGSTLVGMYLGFSELLASGEISRMPRLYGIQAENCNTIARAFNGESLDYEVKPTIAEGISLYRPSKVDEVVRMARESGGAILSVSEEEIASALLQAGSRGFCIEPTTAASFAGVNKLRQSGDLAKGESVGVTLSGTGLKATAAITEIMNAKNYNR